MEEGIYNTKKLLLQLASKKHKEFLQISRKKLTNEKMSKKLEQAFHKTENSNGQ